MAISRRVAVQALGMIGASSLVGSRASGAAQEGDLQIVGQAVELTVIPVGPEIVRVTFTPLAEGKPQPIVPDGSLVALGEAAPSFRTRTLAEPQSFACGTARVTVASNLLTVRIEAGDGRLVQRLQVDPASGVLSFNLGDGPLLGLGEGGPQFDRRGSVDRMRSGQGGYRLRTHGSRVPIPWLIGTSGWAMFIHRPYGSFDLTGPEGKFLPPTPAGSLPMDLFVVTNKAPAAVLASYARLTGFPEMPPLWSLGYQQSHRTLASRAELIAEAQTFRDKKLPCDALIYLGTGFCPSGWNTGHGSWDYNPTVFPDPKGVVDALRGLHFRVIPHIVIRARVVSGSVTDPFDPKTIDEAAAASY